MSFLGDVSSRGEHGSYRSPITANSVPTGYRLLTLIVSLARPWVLLEILSAQHLVLRCGPSKALWDDFCSAPEACDPYKCPSTIKSDGLQMLLAAQAYRRLLAAGPSQSRLIIEIFAAFDNVDLKVFDSPEKPQADEKYWQRDGDAKHKIRAVNCLLHKRFGSYLSESLTGYMHVVEMFKVASWSLNLALWRPFTLSLAGNTNPQEDWPSWVPNWRVFRKRYLLDAPPGVLMPPQPRKGT